MSHKRLQRTTASVLSAIVILAAQACSCTETPPEQTEEDASTGSWDANSGTDAALDDRAAPGDAEPPEAALDAASDAALDAAVLGDAGFACVIPEIERPDGGQEDASGLCPPELEPATGDYSGTWSGHIFGNMLFVGEFDFVTFGDLEFTISCAGSKLWVDGLMTGLAAGGFPFRGVIRGTYDAMTQSLEAAVRPGYLCMSPAVDAGAPDSSVAIDAWSGLDTGIEDAAAEDASSEDAAAEDATAEDATAGDGAVADATYPDTAVVDASMSLDAGAGGADAGENFCSGFVLQFEVALRGSQVQDSFSDGLWCGQSLFPPGGFGDGTWEATRQ